jgi:hypothetical protein
LPLFNSSLFLRDKNIILPPCFNIGERHFFPSGKEPNKREKDAIPSEIFLFGVHILGGKGLSLLMNMIVW